VKEVITIAGTSIGKGQKPFVIAELSGNHNQSIDMAIEMVRAAAASGVQAVKLQTYTADTMTINSQQDEFVINDKSSPWHGQNLYQLYQQAHTPWEWHQEIFNEAKKLGLIAFSTPFDTTAVDFLESLDVPVYKIASFENTDIHLIRRVAQTGKPMIISTGMASVAEIDECVTTCRDAGCSELLLLKCTSSYPADPAESHLMTIPHMQQLFSCHVGLSDHTQGLAAAIASVVLGGAVIEKHFILDRASGGVDADFSLEPDEMKLLVTEVHRAWQALGSVHYGPTKQEKASIKYRRGLYVVKDLKEGEYLTEESVRALRPALGISAKHFDFICGKQVKKEIKPGTPLTWDILL
jgi:pseudaminic acid synthase